MHSILINIVYVLVALIALSVLVIGHEFGHFIMAKVNGVKVLEFSLGMGPKLFSIKGKETEYLIKALPIGGYVRMYGEEDDTEVVDDRAFSNKSSLQKLSIVSAGPIMNLIIAVIFFAIVGGVLGHSTNIVGSVVENSAAMEAGVQVDDKIININGKLVTTWEDFLIEMSEGAGENPISLEVDRKGEKIHYDITPRFNDVEQRYMVGLGTKLVQPTFFEAVGYGFNQSWSAIRQTFGFFGQLFKGKVTADDVGGPISIIKISGKAAEQGILTLMNFMAYISIQFAIFNIIPFPALDGGWIFLLLFQIISGKEVNKEKVATINYYGFIVLMGFMVLVLLKDIIRPIKF